MRNLVIGGVLLVCAALVYSQDIQRSNPAGVPSGRSSIGRASPMAESPRANLQSMRIGTPRLESISATEITTATGASFRIVGDLTIHEPEAHFVGITHATLPVRNPFEGSGILALNRACFEEFPGTRACRFREVDDSIPPPPAWATIVQIVINVEGDFEPTARCLPPDGGFIVECGSEPVPVICCGF